uniref:Serine protease inhibitor n=1 Tax=Bombus ignitus TaxID=130704 RepID=TILI_BOMIG|nr:serine protease inhibitor [Bombus ignitus]UTN00454.1 serine protease inhibitor [Bombus ignitus]
MKMKLLQVHFVLLVSSSFLLGYTGMVTAAILSRPQVVFVEDTCRENEIFSQCQASPNCEKSCDNIDIWESVPCIQTKSCVSGCICEDGYVRDKNQGVCILENSCPRVRH